MKLEKLRLLNNEISDEMSLEGVLVGVYYLYDDTWFELDSELQPNKQVKANLEKCYTRREIFRPVKSKTAWFICQGIDCIVSLTFQNNVQSRTLEVFNTRLNKAVQRAINSYKVSYNQLTQLLARDSFREKLVLKIQGAHELPLSGEIQEDGQDKILAVLALDIDHFKQINDTYGHLYGDQVLKTFAIRLEQCAKKINNDKDVEIHIGHPSGEEFLISICGDYSKEQIVDWANIFRSCICDEPLPSDIEWMRLCEKENLSSVVPPYLHERNVTTSIGIAFYNLSVSEVNNEINSILEDADTALYRAKSAGRNQVVKFEEILHICGRVLEHDAITNIVAIDIGKNVGVLLGQEFKVFPPGYTGKRKFIINDGRTTRSIGTYPRIELTTITIFNVQPEMAFAYISDTKNTSIVIEQGSSLEAIPTGSISHLLTSSSRFLPESTPYAHIGDSSLLQQFVYDNMKDSGNAFSVVYRFSAEEDYLKRYGSAALNKSLAKLFNEVSGKFNSDARVGILDSGSICLVGKGDIYDEQVLIEHFKTLKSMFSELQLRVGVFCQNDIDEADPEKLDAKYSIEFSRYAASDNAADTNSDLVHFNYHTVGIILNSHRKRKAYKQGIVDFENLRKLGVENAYILNLAGLIYYTDGDSKTAADVLELAVIREPNEYIYKTNFGTVTYYMSEYERGLNILNEMSDSDLEKALTKHAFGYYIYTLMLAKAKLKNLHCFKHDRFKLMAENVFNMEEYKNRDSLKIIRAALE
ncbi:GGDEF domain-containing protein [Enterobacter kobei]|uniref:diguanylate cyclase domain-containing protein n=1 Tax=Enterobacter kobei TaxID=208224 RepID=UPI0037549F1E